MILIWLYHISHCLTLCALKLSHLQISIFEQHDFLFAGNRNLDSYCKETRKAFSIMVARICMEKCKMQLY